MIVFWNCVNHGIGNRLFALSSVLALADLGNFEIATQWENNIWCPGEFNDILKNQPGLHINYPLNQCSTEVNCRSWDPLQIYTVFCRELSLDIKLDEYLFCVLKTLRELELNDAIIANFEHWQKHKEHSFNISFHLRLTDRIQHHRNAFVQLFKGNNVRRSVYIVKASGISKSIQYAVLPSNLIIYLENKGLVSAIFNNINNQQNSCYSLYCDSQENLETIRYLTQKKGINPTHYLPGYCELFNEYDVTNLRQTSIQSSMTDILCMANSDAIWQNNPASTFSLIASILGNTPIISRNPHHKFWLEIRNQLGDHPYNILTNSNSY